MDDHQFSYITNMKKKQKKKKNTLVSTFFQAMYLIHAHRHKPATKAESLHNELLVFLFFPQTI
jgi:hypothetical protein